MARPELLILLTAYLLGSIPFGYIFVRYTEGKDIRTLGSGNIGATNVFRRGRMIGALTFLLDAGKGYLAVAVAGWLGLGIEWKAAAAAVAIIGHIFTIWLRFKGGKGVSTGCGAFLALWWPALLTTLVVFLVIAALTRYISAASIGATACFPILAFLYGAPLPVLFWGIIGSLLIIARHHQNIRRLLSGTERKFASGTRS